MKLKLLLPLLMAVLLGACRHKEDKPQMIYVDPLLKQHFAFKPGSYWIYKDSISGRTDSCYVERLDSMMLSYDNNTKIGQIIQLHLIQFSISGPVSDSLIYRLDIKKSWIQIYYTIPGQFGIGGNGIPIDYPFHTGPTWGDDLGSINNIIPDFYLDGSAYKNVAECYQRFNNQPDNYAHLFIDDSIGIVKITISNSSNKKVWELQRCQINK